MNIRLFFLLLVLESASIICGYFFLIIFFFLHFGSGAGASTDNALLTQDITFIILISLPLLFGFYKFAQMSISLQNSKSYLYSGIIVSFGSIIALIVI